MIGQVQAEFPSVGAPLVSGPILTLPTAIGGFTIYSDTCKTSLGYVLMQNDQMVPYASKQLKPCKENYPTHD